MTLITYILAYGLNVLFFTIIPLVEAVIWTFVDDTEMNAEEKKDFHIPLFALRICFYCSLWFSFDWLSLIFLAMCHPFWHLGFLYYFRNLLNSAIYKDGFTASASDTSTSIFDKVMDLNFTVRLCLLIVGTIGYWLKYSFSFSISFF